MKPGASPMRAARRSVRNCLTSAPVTATKCTGRLRRPPCAASDRQTLSAGPSRNRCVGGGGGCVPPSSSHRKQRGKPRRCGRSRHPVPRCRPQPTFRLSPPPRRGLHRRHHHPRPPRASWRAQRARSAAEPPMGPSISAHPQRCSQRRRSRGHGIALSCASGCGTRLPARGRVPRLWRPCGPNRARVDPAVATVRRHHRRPKRRRRRCRCGRDAARFAKHNSPRRVATRRHGTSLPTRLGARGPRQAHPGDRRRCRRDRRSAPWSDPAHP
mmetsp:Transcript_64182/g.186099  ORF Transcript_64182/g.186099 Transcript_64182/m.186099 type:complete len:270 (-) Transcript_64182:760-1569(-)